MDLNEFLRQRPVDEVAVAEHRARMERELREQGDSEVRAEIWRHGGWD